MLALLNGEFRSPPCTGLSRVRATPTRRGMLMKLRSYGYYEAWRRYVASDCSTAFVHPRSEQR